MSTDRAVIEAGIAHARQSLDLAEEALRGTDSLRVAIHLHGAVGAAANAATSAARLLEVEAYARAVSDVVEELRANWSAEDPLGKYFEDPADHIEKWAADRKADTR